MLPPRLPGAFFLLLRAGYSIRGIKIPLIQLFKNLVEFRRRSGEKILNRFSGDMRGGKTLLAE